MIGALKRAGFAWRCRAFVGLHIQRSDDPGQAQQSTAEAHHEHPRSRASHRASLHVVGSLACHASSAIRLAGSIRTRCLPASRDSPLQKLRHLRQIDLCIRVIVIEPEHSLIVPCRFRIGSKIRKTIGQVEVRVDRQWFR